ncbi:hypothetical protein HanRHA438_Chr10g0474101 [Helianthus annuus]|nr:hypothetical protein HanRHA438_Chr10g0474101 [Helianthus annuus]
MSSLILFVPLMAFWKILLFRSCTEEKLNRIVSLYKAFTLTNIYKTTKYEGFIKKQQIFCQIIMQI